MGSKKYRYKEYLILLIVIHEILKLWEYINSYISNFQMKQ